MDQFESVGDYFTAKINKKSDRFLLLFSGVRTAAGKFNYIKSFSNSDFNLIFLNCTEDSYYHKGIEGLGGLDDSIEFLKRFIGRHSETPEIYTFGCSMGGYGSLLYGTLLNATAVLAIGASAPIYSEMLNGQDRRWEHYKVFEEQKVLLESSSVKKIMLYGDSTLNDILSYQLFSSLPNAMCEIYLETPHVLVMLLAQVMPLKKLVEVMIEQRLNEISFETTEHYKGSTWLVGYSDNGQRDGVRGPENFVSDINAYNLTDFTYTELYVVGIAYLKFKLPDKALQCFTLSLQRLFTYRALKRVLDLNLSKDELSEILSITNKGICKGDLLRLSRSDFDEAYGLYCILNDKVKPTNSYQVNAKMPGFVDGFFKSAIKGWCYTENIEKQGVIFKINDLMIAEHKSNLYRKDLENHGLGDGKHGFSFDINFKSILKLMSNLSLVKASLIDKATNYPLPKGDILIKAPYPLFQVDKYEVESFSGWIIDYSYPTRNIILDIFINKVFVQRIEPNVARADLEYKGFCKMSGFDISLVGLLKTGSNTLVFKDSETGLNVSNVINIKG
jgi:hypothetical protein